jgi:hypothetical protein
MPAYKKQHYLPSAYLKYFSVDQANCNRKSSVWRFDGKVQRCVPIESQCFADYLYSKEKAAEAEIMFQSREKTYCQFVDKIRTKQEPTGHNCGDLFLSMFDFHLRNAIHKNRTGKEGIEAYDHRIQIAFSQILLGRNDGKMPKANIIDHIQHYWRLEIISISSDNQFVTSDHPSVWITVKKSPNGLKPELQLITLPLTPKHTAVAFDRRVLEIVNKPASLSDVVTLNVGQIENAEQCVYMSGRLKDGDIAVAKNCFARKPASVCEVNEGGWKLILQYLPYEHHFSFMRLRPPLV